MEGFFHFIGYLFVAGVLGSCLVVVFVLVQMAKAVATPGPLEETHPEPGMEAAAKEKSQAPGNPLHTH